MEQFSSEPMYFRCAIYLVNKKRWSMRWIVSAVVEDERLQNGFRGGSALFMSGIVHLI